MNTYTVSIGRNVADTPMDAGLWENFITTVRDTLDAYRMDHGSWIETHRGTGEYGTIVEESATITLLSDRILVAGEIDSLKFFLRAVSRAFEQECVALTIGTSELI